jgi:prevent-host-death family protein
MVYDYGTNHGMRDIAISKFKATCLAVLEDVRRTGAPVTVTRFGKPVAEIVPPRPRRTTSWLGCMKDSMEVSGDIVGPIGAFRRWTADQE